MSRELDSPVAPRFTPPTPAREISYFLEKGFVRWNKNSLPVWPQSRKHRTDRTRVYIQCSNIFFPMMTFVGIKLVKSYRQFYVDTA